MSKIIYIFILLSCFGFNDTQSKSELILNKSSKEFTREIFTSHLNAIDSGNPKDNILSKKGKKRKKAIQPILVRSAEEQHFKIIDLKDASTYFLETFYCFCPYFGDDERGPPIA